MLSELQDAHEQSGDTVSQVSYYTMLVKVGRETGEKWNIHACSHVTTSKELMNRKSVLDLKSNENEIQFRMASLLED